MFAKALLTVLLGSAAVSAQLHSLAVGAGLEYFGTTVDERHVNSDAQYRSILEDTNEFGQVVPENGQKWSNVAPSRGSFTYTQGDIVRPLLARMWLSHVLNGLRLGPQLRPPEWPHSALPHSDLVSLSGCLHVLCH